MEVINPSKVDARIFYPNDHLHAHALVFVPKVFTAKNAYGKPEMLCSVAIFEDESDFQRSIPSNVYPNIIVSSGRLVRALQRVLEAGGILVGWLDRSTDVTPGFDTHAWVIQDLDEDELDHFKEVVWPTLESALS